MILATVAAAVAAQAGQAWTMAAVPAGLDTIEVRAVEVTSDGAVWIGAGGNRGLGRIDGDQVTWLTEHDGLMSNGVADILEDRDGTVWVAGLGGIAVRAAGTWERHAAFGGLEPRVVFHVYQEPDAAGGSMWLAAAGGAAHLEDGRWSVYGPSDGLPHGVVHDVVVDDRGVAWLACRTGLARIDGDEVTVLFPDLNIRTALAGDDGSLWFGTSDGLRRWDGSSWTTYLEGRTVYPSLAASDGAVWAGSAGAGVFRFTGGAWRSVPLPADWTGVEVYDLAEGDDGSIWLASARGLGRLVAGSE